MIIKRLLLTYLCLVLLIVNGCLISTADSDDDMAVTMQAEGYPAVVTNASTNVEEITATLNGYLIDGGLCTYGFDYDIDSGVPYANSVWGMGNINTGDVFSYNVVALSMGTLHYFRAKASNINGTTYGGELTFLTKPNNPTNFQAVRDGVVIQNNLSWTKGTGADKTVIVKKIGSYPVNRADGTVIYNGTTTTYEDGAVVSGIHYFYRVWSYTTAGIHEQYSDGYDEDSIIALAPATFDIRNIVVTDSAVPTLAISVVVENKGGILADIPVSWQLTRVDNGVVLDMGSDTFAVSPFSEYIYTIHPITSYVGSVMIKFIGDGASASEMFTTTVIPPTGGAGYVPPAPILPPEEYIPPPMPTIEIEIPLILTFPVMICIAILILIIIYRREEEKKKRRYRRRKPQFPWFTRHTYRRT